MMIHFKNTFINVHYYKILNIVYYRIHFNSKHVSFDINLDLHNNDLYLDFNAKPLFTIKGTELRITKAKELLDQLTW